MSLSRSRSRSPVSSISPTWEQRSPVECLDTLPDCAATQPDVSSEDSVSDTGSQQAKGGPPGQYPGTLPYPSLVPAAADSAACSSHVRPVAREVSTALSNNSTAFGEDSYNKSGGAMEVIDLTAEETPPSKLRRVPSCSVLSHLPEEATRPLAREAAVRTAFGRESSRSHTAFGQGNSCTAFGQGSSRTTFGECTNTSAKYFCL